MNASRLVVLVAVSLSLLPGSAQAATVPATVHPDWSKIDLRPAGFQPQVSGMTFLSDGRLAVAHWDTTRGRGNNVTETVRAYSGKVYLLSGVLGNTPNVTIDTIVRGGLEDVMGLAAVNDTLYVSGGNVIVRLNRNGNAGPVVSVDTLFILPGTPAEGSTDSLKPRHGSQEYLNGLLYKDGKFYVSPSSLDPIGSIQGSPQVNPYRGTYLEVTPGNGTSNKRGSFRIVANGIRAASGLGVGPEGRHCVPDNQGDWLPANKLICIQEGKFYGAKKPGGLAESYYAPWESLTETPPTVWAIQNEIANSPTAPILVPYGPYEGQILMGDVRWGGIQRYFLEKNAQGDWQGAAFVFTGGLEAGVFRLAFGPDSMLYVGMLGGRNDNDGYPKSMTSQTRVDYGLQKLRWNGTANAFEMRAVRARPAGFEIEFSKPVDTTVAKLAASYTVQSYHMTPTSAYGGGSKLSSSTLTPSSILVSPDRRKVYLALGEIPVSTPTRMRVVYIRLNDYKSETQDAPWSNETWYTLNGAGTGNVFDDPTALAPPGAGRRALAGARVSVRAGRLIVEAAHEAPYVVTLHDPRGALLARMAGQGRGETSFALPAARGTMAVVSIRSGETIHNHGLIPLP